MKPLTPEQRDFIHDVFINGLAPVRNYLELIGGDATEAERQNHCARAIDVIDKLIEKCRKEL